MIRGKVVERAGRTIFLGITLLVLGCAEKKSAEPTAIERGKYLVTIGGCHDCHTPKVPGPGGAPILDDKRLLAGHPEGEPFPSWSATDLKQRNAVALTNPSLTAWAGPWGVSFAINLTPDNSTGIGEWSETNFIQALRTGKHQGQPNGRDILPPMPWQNTKAMTHEDLKALYAYLRSIPPVKNPVLLPVSPGGTTPEVKS